METLVSWFTTEFSSGKSVILLIIALFISIVIVVIVNQSKSPGVSCVIKLNGTMDDHPLWKAYIDSGFRGTDYFGIAMRDAKEDISQIREWEEISKMCPMTMWGGCHFILYLILGFICPCFFFQLFLIGVLWELFESLHHCSCTLDLLWNFLGLIIGVGIRSYMYPRWGCGIPRFC